jgi:hypothetical protein
MTVRAVTAAMGPGEGYSVMVAQAPSGRGDTLEATGIHLIPDAMAHELGSVSKQMFIR